MATISTFTYDKNLLPTTKEMQEVRQKYADLYNQVDQAYTDLVNSGRLSEAARLRESAEKFARTGSEAGVSPMARAAALDNLKSAMRVQGMAQEAQNTAAGLSQKASILGGLKDASASQFNQAMSLYSAQRSPLSGSTVARGGTSVNPMPIMTSSQGSSRAVPIQRSPLMDTLMQRNLASADQMKIANAVKGTSGAPMGMSTQQAMGYSGFGAKPTPTVSADGPKGQTYGWGIGGAGSGTAQPSATSPFASAPATVDNPWAKQSYLSEAPVTAAKNTITMNGKTVTLADVQGNPAITQPASVQSPYSRALQNPVKSPFAKAAMQNPSLTNRLPDTWSNTAVETVLNPFRAVGNYFTGR